jgi:hypothetical protein
MVKRNFSKVKNNTLPGQAGSSDMLYSLDYGTSAFSLPLDHQRSSSNLY